MTPQAVEMSMSDRVAYFQEIELETQVIVITEPSDATKIASIQAGHRHPPPDQTQGTYLGLVDADAPSRCTVKIATTHGIRFFSLTEILACNALETEEQQAYRQAKLMLDEIASDDAFTAAMAKPVFEVLEGSRAADLQWTEVGVRALIRDALRAGREYAEAQQKAAAHQTTPMDPAVSGLAERRASTEEPPASERSASPAIEAVERLARETGARFPGPEADTPAPTPEGADQSIDERANPGNTADAAYDERPNPPWPV